MTGQDAPKQVIAMRHDLGMRRGKEGSFASESFTIVEMHCLNASQLIEGTPVVGDDRLYILRSPQHPACPATGHPRGT